MRKFVVVGDNGKYAGYVNYCKSFAIPRGLSVLSLEQAIDFVPQEAGAIISAGSMGIEIAEGILTILDNPQDYIFCLMADRFVQAGILNNFGEVVIIAPSHSAEMFKAVCPNAMIITADLAPSPSSEVLAEYVQYFNDNNTEAAEIISDAEYFGFIGGRVQLPDGGWKDITIDDFIHTGASLLKSARGKNLFIAVHGGRGVTLGDGTLFLDPSNALCNMMQQAVIEGQTISVLTAVATETGRKAVLRVLTEDGEKTIDVDNKNASGYYLGLAVAAEKEAWISFTAEQMNLTKEALNLGAKFGQLIPMDKKFGWNLTVPSNMLTHKAVAKAYYEDEPIETLDEALGRYFS